MSKILVFLFVTFLYFLNAEEETTNQGGLEWPFYMGSDGNVYTDIKIGYPEQEIQVSLNYFHQNRDLIVVPKYSGNSFFGGQYVMNASKTLIHRENINRNDVTIGSRADEDFQIGNRHFDGARFILSDNVAEFEFKAVLGFGVPDYEIAGFWDSFYDYMPQKTITIAYNNYPKNGVLIAGKTPNKYCHNKWTTFQQTYWHNKDKKRSFGKEIKDLQLEPFQTFGVEIEKIMIGKSQFSEARGKKVVFKLSDEKIQWPVTMYYDMIWDGLGSKDNKTISCHLKKTIRFMIKDSFTKTPLIEPQVYIELTPEMYLEKEEEGEFDVCKLTGVVVNESNEFSLPRSFFKRNCLSISPYDKTIGIAALHVEKQTTIGPSLTTPFLVGAQQPKKLGGEANLSSSKLHQLSLIFLLAVKLIVFKYF